MRNSFLAGALELRDGFTGLTKLNAGGPDVTRAIPTELLFDYLAILIDGRKASGLYYRVNFITPDNNEKFLLELSNETLSTIKGVQSDNADLTITINRKDLELMLIGKSTMPLLMQSGKLKLEGNKKIIGVIKSLIEPFTPDFEIIPGTASETTD